MPALPVCSRAHGEKSCEFPKIPGPPVASESLLDSGSPPLPAQVLLVLLPEGSSDLPGTSSVWPVGLCSFSSFHPHPGSSLPGGNPPGETAEPLFTGD